MESYVRLLNSDTFVIESNEQLFDDSILEVFPNGQELWDINNGVAA